MDRRQLRHRARRLRAALPPGRQGHGARLSVDRMPRHDRARGRNARRPAAAPSSFLRVRANRTNGTPAGPCSWGSTSSSRARRYYILITTASGLYRYFMNDLVEVDGTVPPARRSSGSFRRARGVTSLTGEKLYEAQVIEAVQETARRHGFVPRLLPARRATRSPPAYHLFLETDAAAGRRRRVSAADIDRRLGELNIEYHSKRASGRLAPLTIAWLQRGAGEAYKTACVRAGQREGQFKPAVLQYRSDLALDVRALCRRMTSCIDELRFGELRIPFTVAFRHASAERTETRDGLDRCRSARTAASAAASRAPGRTSRARRSPRLARSRRNTRRRCGSRSTTSTRCARGHAAHMREIDANPAAWCALELAVLDLLGRRRGAPVETLLSRAAARRRPVPLHRRSRRCGSGRFPRHGRAVPRAGLQGLQGQAVRRRRTRPRQDGDLRHMAGGSDPRACRREQSVADAGRGDRGAASASTTRFFAIEEPIGKDRYAELPRIADAAALPDRPRRELPAARPAAAARRPAIAMDRSTCACRRWVG